MSDHVHNLMVSGKDVPESDFIHQGDIQVFSQGYSFVFVSDLFILPVDVNIVPETLFVEGHLISLGNLIVCEQKWGPYVLSYFYGDISGCSTNYKWM